VLNVASAAGLLAAPGMGPYNVTKSAVVALSETLYGELAGTGVGVSVLCPTFFRTNIANASRLTGRDDQLALVNTLMAGAKIQAEGVARLAIDAVERGTLYVLPHPDGRWLWKIKRLAPRAFHTLTPKLLALRAGRRGA
jgi:short-subunit dehydrogenase